MSAKPRTSFAGFQPAFAAQSSQNGEPVSGEKCHWIISRACASSLSWADLIADGSTTLVCIQLLRGGGFEVHFRNLVGAGAGSVMKRVQVRVRLDVHHPIGNDRCAIHRRPEIRPILFASIHRNLAENL